MQLHYVNVARLSWPPTNILSCISAIPTHVPENSTAQAAAVVTAAAGDTNHVRLHPMPHLDMVLYTPKQSLSLSCEQQTRVKG